jgi:hypothetical protein
LFGVLLIGEHEDLEAAALAECHMPVTGERQVAERPQRVEILADALLLLERDPVRSVPSAPQYAAVDAHR